MSNTRGLSRNNWRRPNEHVFDQDLDDMHGYKLRGYNRARRGAQLEPMRKLPSWVGGRAPLQHPQPINEPPRRPDYEPPTIIDAAVINEVHGHLRSDRAEMALSVGAVATHLTVGL